MKQLNYIVKSIPEFLSVIHKINKHEEVCWYRGQKDARYLLTPNLYRPNKLSSCNQDDADVYSLNIDRGSIPYRFKNNQRQAFENFKKNALAFVENRPTNDFEWLVLMQHYGGDTQLLDWTINPLISLYFAISNITYDPQQVAKDGSGLKMKKYLKNATTNNKWINAYHLQNFDSSDYAVVYVINPLRINTNSSLRITNPNIILTSEEKYQDLLAPYLDFDVSSQWYPICIEAPKNDKRTYIQGSTFTLHGSLIDGLDWFTCNQNLVYKIYIPNKKAIKMKEDLKKIYHITHGFVYQDLANVVKDAYE